MAEEYLERERKYDVPPDFSLPSLPGAEHQTHHLQADYYDTEDALLQARGVTLRRRLGGDDDGWHLKIAMRDGKLELQASAESTDPPEELVALTRGLRLDRPLHRRAVLNTVRDAFSLYTPSGDLVAEVADDSVSATVEATGDSGHWREVEVELGPAGTDEAMERLCGQLEAAGARESRVGSKLARAVGEPPTPTRPGLAGLVDDYLRRQYDRLAWGDLRLRRGHNTVHKTRVAVRRLRSTLRIFAPLFEEARRVDLDDELSWYAEALGAVRDLDVARRRLEPELHPEDDEHVSPEAADGLLRLLKTERDHARDELRTILDGKRYGELLHRLGAWRSNPPYTEAAEVDEDEVETYVTRAQEKSDKRLRQAAAAEGPDADEALHRARKAGKRTRYASELARPALGKSAKRVAKAYEERQDELGELQDHRMVVELLQDLADRETTSREIAFVCGLLAERHAHALAKARREWT